MRWIGLVVLAAAFPLCAGEWAEKTLKNMSLEEKVGQLIIVPACPLRSDDRHRADIEEALSRYRIGGIIIKQGSIEEQFQTIQETQAKAPIPLLVVADAEWGLTMRASDAIRFPRNMTLGALDDPAQIEDMGREVGRQLRALGVHMNLAPVVDVNSNPLNPIIRMRSFGDDPRQVAHRAELFARGLQSAGIIGCAKHFPGHGDTAVDSHRALPFIDRTLLELEKVELPPFQAMIENGIAAVMSAHIVATAIDSLPASLSYLCMTKLLQEKMGFRGLIITDALNMEALAANYSPKDIAVLAFKAGHDLLLYGDHIAPRIDDILEEKLPTACSAIKQAVLSGEIAEEELDRRVRKILEAKERLALPSKSSFLPFVPEVFQNASAKNLAASLYRNAVTLVSNDKALLPLAQTVIVDDEGRGFAARLQNRGISLTDDAHLVIVAVSDLRTQQDQEKAQARLKNWMEQGKEIVAIVFGSPYSVPFMAPFAHAIALAYEDCEDAWEAAADLCSGALLPKGKLPVEIAKL